MRRPTRYDPDQTSRQATGEKPFKFVCDYLPIA
jgi:hypothetical protein